MTRICLSEYTYPWNQHVYFNHGRGINQDRDREWDARPYLDTTFVRVADDVHLAFGKLDDAFLLEFLDRLYYSLCQ